MEVDRTTLNNTNHINGAREAFSAVEEPGEHVLYEYGWSKELSILSIFPNSYITLEKILHYQAQHITSAVLGI